MTVDEVRHAQWVLRQLRDEVDMRTASVVRSSVQGEDVAEGTFVSDPLLEVVRYWPEAGWPDQLGEVYNAHQAG